MPNPIILKAADFAPLLADPTYMKGTIDALDAAMRAEYEGRIRQKALADEAGEGDSKSTLSFGLIASDGLPHNVTIAGSGGGVNSRFVMLFDEKTRELLAIMDVSPFNPVRVGAEGALGCRYLASPGAKTLAMIGSARQARTQMAAICNLDMLCFDLGADAAIHKSKRMAEQALMLDPLTAAVCCPAEIRELTTRMFESEAEFLPGFK